MARTRQKDRDVPAPDGPWSEIVPRLWMGGHYWTDALGELRTVVVDNEFDLVISLFWHKGHGPAPAVEHHVAEMPDGPLTAGQIDRVRRLAVLAAAAVRAGRTTFVRCHSGYNRSGLVSAQALIELGLSPAEAIALIRRRRSPWALHNPAFEDYLTTGLDVAYLLTGLEESPA